MKQLIVAALAVCSVTVTAAQQTKGKIQYESSMNLSNTMANIELPAGVQIDLPKEVKNYFELNFANNQSFWAGKEVLNEPSNSFSSGSATISFRGAGNAGADVFTDLGTKIRTEKLSLFDKEFIVEDSVATIKWKVTGETKKILDFTCAKAVAQTDIATKKVSMVNGEMKTEDVTKTVDYEAWFTPAIPVAVGPSGYEGGLPGAILELKTDRLHYIATEVSEAVNEKVIKAPKGKKKYTKAEFKVESDKVMEEFRKNAGNGPIIRRTQIN